MLIHLQKESVLPIDHYSEAKGRVQDNIIALHVNPHRAVRSIGEKGKLDQPVIHLERGQSIKCDKFILVRAMFVFTDVFFFFFWSGKQALIFFSISVTS